MINNEAIKWLGNLKNDLGNPHYECLWPYAQAIDEICELLEEHEPRVMTMEEVKTAEVVFLEFQDVITTRIVDTWFGNGDGDIRLAGMDGTLYMAKAAYNDSWRCWTSRPDEKRRAETPWES